MKNKENLELAQLIAGETFTKENATLKIKEKMDNLFNLLIDSDEGFLKIGQLSIGETTEKLIKEKKMKTLKIYKNYLILSNILREEEEN
jgi:hypothetical protein